MERPWYHLNDAEQFDSPALLIYRDRVQHNISTLLSIMGDRSRLRPHIKTNKSKGAVQLLMEAGIYKYKCATIAEAELLGQVGAADVLLAYQPTGPKIRRLLALKQTYPETHFSCLIDTIEIAKALSELAASVGDRVSVFVDVNVGMNRTGIKVGKSTAELYQQAAKLSNVMVRGMHVYDGHLRHSDFEERKKVCDDIFDQVWETDRILRLAGSEPEIVAGGSPTFPIHAQRERVDCSPGTFIYWDHGYSEVCAEQPFLPAAIVISRVISRPAPNLLCLDLGHKSIAPENPLDRRVHFLNAPDLKFVGQSEEHLVVEVPETHSWQVGDIFFGVPKHICPTVALYDTASVIENGGMVEEWKNIARDRKITI